jgi:hypothetical protein
LVIPMHRRKGCTPLPSCAAPSSSPYALHLSSHHNNIVMHPMLPRSLGREAARSRWSLPLPSSPSSAIPGGRGGVECHVRGCGWRGHSRASAKGHKLRFHGGMAGAVSSAGSERALEAPLIQLQGVFEGGVEDWVCLSRGCGWRGTSREGGKGHKRRAGEVGRISSAMPSMSRAKHALMEPPLNELERPAKSPPPPSQVGTHVNRSSRSEADGDLER